MLHKTVRGIVAAVVAGALLTPAPVLLAAPNPTGHRRLTAPSSVVEMVLDRLSAVLAGFFAASTAEPNSGDDSTRVSVAPDSSNLTETTPQPTAEPTTECGPYIDPHG